MFLGNGGPKVGNEQEDSLSANTANFAIYIDKENHRCYFIKAFNTNHIVILIIWRRFYLTLAISYEMLHDNKQEGHYQNRKYLENVFLNIFARIKLLPSLKLFLKIFLHNHEHRTTHIQRS